ncbi:MAG: ATP-binding protein [Polaromonas sp.]|uniref:ATP-binding protein n=1 Tax=Polaromonas sp. TaxID=1869339 RepID=UPI0027333E29|nr:ATP-binding protein [Polaromonas sp.]MDP3799794.1 ATP-binding protein [Polaromonas sp.]
MSSRLRRMLLINARTSGSLSSGAINEVDPRKGAAVTGENSVGKTTTLELIPLFFGTLPSQIAESGGGREPMLRFVLPTPQSAIVFEYQRGNDEEQDVRCVVIRRPSGSEAAEYRFIRGPFNEDLFTMDAPESLKVFTDDAQLVEAARAKAVATTRKLTSADYRSVILGLKATNHDARELRVMSGDYSFGNRGRGLPHLDRLISAVVKERVNFRDFIHVSVTMIQDAIGGAASAGLDRNKFSLRQSRSQIERWLDDREACDAAFKLEPRIAKLREAINGFNRAEAQLRDERQQIPLLLNVRTAALSVRQAALKSLEAARLKEVDTEDDTLRRLQTEAVIARQGAQQSEQRRQTEEMRRDSLHLGKVEDWAAQFDQVPGLIVQLSQIDEQIRTAQGRSEGISQTYDRQINEVELAAAREDGRLQELKRGPYDRLEAERVDFESVKNTRLHEAEAAHGQALSDLNVAAGVLSERIGEARALAEHSGASPAALDAVSLAETNSDTHQHNLHEASERVRQTNEAVTKADAAFRVVEHHRTEAHRQKQAAEASLQSAQALLAPGDGTLLSSLRAADPDAWKATLARVLDPDLLKRKDLAPQFLSDEASEMLYGWSLSTHKIDLPLWADDDALRNRVAAAQDLVKSTGLAAAGADTDLSRASSVLDAAKKAFGIADSELSVFRGKTGGMQEAVKLAKARRDREVQEARKTAQNQIAGLVREQQGVSAQLLALAQRHQAERDIITRETTHQLAQAQNRYTAAIEAIEKQRAGSSEAAAKRKAGLESQRDAHLANEKVDVPRLNALRKERNALAGSIQEIEARETTVNLWRIWLAEGGHSILEGLKAAEVARKAAQAQANETLTKHERDRERSRQRFNREQAGLSEDVDRLQSDVHMLGSLMEQHPASRGNATLLDPDRPAASLRARIAELDADADRAEDQVRQHYRSIKEELTGKPSSIKELVEQSLQEFSGQSVIRQADELCTIYRTLGRQIVPNLNNEVAAILEHIRQFRKKITDFETEAVRYNNRLQAGLDSVAGFKRLKDFKINVVTDFDTLGFMKKLDAIDDITRDNKARVIIDHERDLPDVKTAAALRDFMSVLGQNAALEVDLSRHINLSGSVTVSDVVKHFKRESDLEHIASTGLNAIILITLLSGMLNMIRGSEAVYIPWVTDEVGKFDPGNFKALMEMLRENRIDVVTASPKLTIAEFRHFERCYVFSDRGRIARYALPVRRVAASAAQPVLEA